MINFYLDPSSNQDYKTQWLLYLKANNYDKNITKLLGKVNKISDVQINNINNSLALFNEDQKQSLEKSIRVIAGKLDEGIRFIGGKLDLISDELSDISYELNSIYLLLDWKLSLIIEEQRLTNILLGDIKELLKIPDSQKEKQFNIEQGVKFLKNAFIDEQYYPDALRYFEEANKPNADDYFVLHRLALIYMFSERYLDIPKAKELFLQSYKYGLADINSNQFSHRHIFTAKANSSEHLLFNTKLEVCESLLFAAKCCYINSEFDEAVVFCDKGIEIMPEFLEMKFMKAKNLIRLNKTNEASNLVNEIHENNRYYTAKMSFDYDFISNDNIYALIYMSYYVARDKAREEYNECQQFLTPNSIAYKELEAIQKLIKHDDYISYHNARLLLSNIRNRSFDSFDSMLNFYPQLQFILDYFKVFFDEVAQLNNMKISSPYRKLTEVLDLLNNYTLWVFSEFNENDLDVLFSNSNKNTSKFIKPKVLESSLIVFLQREKEFVESLDDLEKKLSSLHRSIISKEITLFENENNTNFLSCFNIGKISAFFGVFLIIGAIVGLIPAVMARSYFIAVWGNIILIFGIIGAFVGFFEGRAAKYKYILKKQPYKSF